VYFNQSRQLWLTGGAGKKKSNSKKSQTIHLNSTQEKLYSPGVPNQKLNDT
jgi:hypothetical protein